MSLEISPLFRTLFFHTEYLARENFLLNPGAHFFHSAYKHDYLKWKIVFVYNQHSSFALNCSSRDTPGNWKCLTFYCWYDNAVIERLALYKLVPISPCSVNLLKVHTVLIWIWSLIKLSCIHPDVFKDKI